jgi:hypothetical protein
LGILIEKGSIDLILCATASRNRKVIPTVKIPLFPRLRLIAPIKLRN